MAKRVGLFGVVLHQRFTRRITQLIMHARRLEIGNCLARRTAFEPDNSQTRPRELSAEYGADQADPNQNCIYFRCCRGHGSPRLGALCLESLSGIFTGWT